MPSGKLKFAERRKKSGLLNSAIDDCKQRQSEQKRELPNSGKKRKRKSDPNAKRRKMPFEMVRRLSPATHIS